MELFSHKYGYKPVKSIMQVQSMDDDLRNSLWNAIHIFYLKWGQSSLIKLNYN